MIAESVEQWKLSKQKNDLTPGKIIKTDRNWTEYSKKQLLSYVDIL